MWPEEKNKRAVWAATGVESKKEKKSGTTGEEEIKSVEDHRSGKENSAARRRRNKGMQKYAQDNVGGVLPR